MILLYYLLIFVFGTIVGSFLNCVIYRLEQGKSFLQGRSFCPNCKHKLGFFDLIPILSFIMLKGRCRYCQKKISIQYPLVEIAVGLMFLLIFNFQFQGYNILPYLKQGSANEVSRFLFSIFNQFSIFNVLSSIRFIYLLVISSLLVIIFVFDLKHYIIPDKVIYLAISVSGIWYSVLSILGLYTKYEILNTLYAVFGSGGFFFLIWLVSRGKWMGFGDVKLAVLMGLLLGINVVVALAFAFFSGAIVGLGLIAFGKKKLKSQVAFGPFLIVGTFVALFWGQELIKWYTNLYF